MRGPLATIGHRLEALGRRLWRWLFPPRAEPPVEAMAVLRAVYPTLDLGAVSFHRGIPHLIWRLESEAIVIPALLARQRTCVYVAEDVWDFRDTAALGTLVHEAYHALQVQDAGWGLGPWRPFLILYFAHGAANGFRYRGHPMEEDAYTLAGEKNSRFEAACARGAVGPAALAGIEEAGLVTAASGVRFWRDLVRSLPGPRSGGAGVLAWPLLPLWSGVWALASVLFWLLRLAVETAGAAVAGTLMGIGLFVKSMSELLYLND